MKIERDGKSITLTDGELEQAYREQERMYRLNDAENELRTYLFGDSDDYENDKYTMADFEAMCDEESDMYLLDSIVDYFIYDYSDMNVGERVAFELAIEKALDSLN